MKVLTFHVAGTPIAKGRPRFARVGRKCRSCGIAPQVRTYTPKATVAFEELVGVIAKCAARKAGIAIPITVPLVCRVLLVFPCGSVGRWAQDGKPDLENVVKAIWDGLERAGVIENDASIVELHVQKRFGTYGVTTVDLMAYQGGIPLCVQPLELAERIIPHSPEL